MANSYPLNYVSSNLNKIISEMVTSYSEEAYKKVDEVTQKVAEDFASRLKDVTPRSDYDTEHLADTIQVTAKSQSSYGRSSMARYVHYKKWQLGHLLEFGWRAKNGRFITRTPFVRPLFDTNKERYYSMYKEALTTI